MKSGVTNLARKIKKYNKGFYIHYKFEGDKKTINEINKKIKIDSSIIRYLIVKYKKLDTKKEYLAKRIANEEEGGKIFKKRFLTL